jgi:hypothetical protein
MVLVVRILMSKSGFKDNSEIVSDNSRYMYYLAGGSRW